MNTADRSHGMWILIVCIPALLLFIALAGMGVGFHPGLIWDILILCCVVMLYFMAGMGHTEHGVSTQPERPRASAVSSQRVSRP
ncbi:MAG: hypothetical protein HKN07_07995 [Acidimicrobiia bacterium]|nr:hypothetical protein [Acidimicrobiia bacterium]